MSPTSRREFSKLVGGAALTVPLAPALAWPAAQLERPERKVQRPETPAPQAKPAEASSAQPAEVKPEPMPKLTPEQEEAVRKALVERDKRLATMRSRVLPYDLEPAFVFQVRQRPRSGKP
jgi:hypothetical protein